MTLPNLENHLTSFIAALPAALAVIAGGLILNFFVKRALKILADRTSLTPGDIAPFAKVGSWFIFVGTAVALLSVFGFDLGGMWTMITGVGAMIAVGFIAVWSVLSNWLCTFVILLTRPFAVGDEVEFVGEQVKGRVVDLNFIYTTLQCADGATLQVPNNMFFQKVLKRHRTSEGGQVSLADQLNRAEKRA
jgi:small-conductance mechanosensitive channel